MTKITENAQYFGRLRHRGTRRKHVHHPRRVRLVGPRGLGLAPRRGRKGRQRQRRAGRKKPAFQRQKLADPESSPGKLVVAADLDGIMVIDTDDVLLVAKKQERQEIKKVVGEVKKSFGDLHL